MATLTRVSIHLLQSGLKTFCDTRQETLRGTSKEILFPALAARISHAFTKNLGWYFGSEKNHRVIAGLGLAWAACAYKGLSERTWLGEWGAIAILPTVNKLIDYVTTRYRVVRVHRTFERKYYLSEDNQDRAQFVLKTVALMAQAAALYYLQVRRNPALPMKPYLYYGAGVVLLSRLNNRYGIGNYLDSGIPSDDKLSNECIQAVSNLVFGFVLAKGINRFTGETLVISRKWELLSNLSVPLASIIHEATS